MPKTSSLYSIGHGHKSAEEFVNELKSFGIEYLIDVRSSPYSKWAPDFNRGTIENWLAKAGIKYGYMGDVIGGRPLNDACYDDHGFFDYKKMAMEPTFEKGILRLVNANKQQFKVAVMCSESEPSECHRSKLIGRELYFTYDLKMTHITGIGQSKSQETIMQDLTKNGWNPQQMSIFEDVSPYFKSRKAHKKVSETEELYNTFPYD